MRTQQTFGIEFEKLYNSFNETEKGKQLLRLEGIDRAALDIGMMSQKYFTEDLGSISIDANSNANESICPSGYSGEIVKGMMKLDGMYLLHHYAEKRFGLVRANELLSAIFSGLVYFHDSSGAGIQQNYCFAYSTSMIMTEGRPYGQLHSLPPKRAKSFTAQVIETTMNLSMEFVGAIAISDFLVNYSWYAKNEELSDADIVNDLQSLIWVLNNKFRTSGQSAFTNISIFDRPNLEKIFAHHTYPDGSSPDFDYIMKVQKLYAEFFANGDPSTGLPFRFPISTINISCDENKNIPDQEFLDWASKINTPTGCFNIYVNEGTKLASCCRLLSDSSRMPFMADSFGNGGVSLGSHRVVTINLPRIALLAEGNVERFEKQLIKALDIARDLLLVHREEIIERRIAQGFLQFYQPLKWFSMKQMFSTFGITGMYEANYFMGLNIREDGGQRFTSDILQMIDDYAVKTSRETGHSFNCEEVPAESVAIKLCQKDKILFGETPFEMYSNQFIPLVEPASIPERIKITGKFCDIMSGGSILHINLMEKIKDPDTMKKLIEYAVKNGVSHFAVNYAFGTCENGHITVCGNSTVCPICSGKITDWMTRIVGYYTHISSWSPTRRDWEFPRREFGEVKALS